MSGHDDDGQPFVAGVYPLLLDETCFFLTVPRAIVEGLQVAASKGAYFNRYIKDRFPYQCLV